MKLLNSVRALLALPDKVSADLRDVERSLRAAAKASDEEAKKNRSTTQALRGELESLRDEVHERLLQYHLQLGRLSSLVNGGREGSYGKPVPTRALKNGDGDAAFEHLP